MRMKSRRTRSRTSIWKSRRGEYVSIAGPSGCGKSTLLSILGLLDSPTSGNYWLDGKSVAHLSASERARIRNCEIGFIFQAFNLIGDLSVYENVELPSDLSRHGLRRTEDSELSKRWSASGWRHRMRHFPSQFPAGSSSASPSRGRWPASHSFCWRTSPPAISTRKAANRVMELLRDLHQEGATICLVTHDSHYARMRRAHHSSSRWPRNRGEPGSLTWMILKVDHAGSVSPTAEHTRSRGAPTTALKTTALHPVAGKRRKRLTSFQVSDQRLHLAGL